MKRVSPTGNLIQPVDSRSGCARKVRSGTGFHIHVQIRWAYSMVQELVGHHEWAAKDHNPSI